MKRAVIPEVVVVNEATTFSDAEVAAILPALRRQVVEHYAPVYGLQADVGLKLYQGGEAPPGAWQLVFVDTSDVAGEAGYHETTKEDLPVVYVFTRTCQEAGQSISACASHELLEMLADPWIQVCQAVSDDTIQAFEVCDPVGHDTFGYRLDGVLVSDFVLPSWFVAGSSGPWDHGGHVTAPLQILPGGYIARLPYAKGQWEQAGAGAQPSPSIHQAGLPGSRFHRRRLARAHWKKSRR